MTPETARILATALLQRDRAGIALRLHGGGAPALTIAENLVTLAEEYVHEQRIINRIIDEARDE